MQFCFTLSFYILIFSRLFLMSLSISSIPFGLGLPILLSHSRIHCVTLFAIFIGFFLIICPTHLRRWDLVMVSPPSWEELIFVSSSLAINSFQYAFLHLFLLPFPDNLGILFYVSMFLNVFPVTVLLTPLICFVFFQLIYKPNYRAFVSIVFLLLSLV